MYSSFPIVVTKQCITEYSRWLKTIAREENLSVIFFPKIFRNFRVKQFLEDKQNLFSKYLINKDNYIFEDIDIDNNLINNKQSLKNLLLKQVVKNHTSLNKISSFEELVSMLILHNQHLVIIIPEAEKYLIQDNYQILRLLDQLAEKNNPKILFMCLFSKDITHLSFLRNTSTLSSIFQNILYYPLYSKEDTLVFINYLEKKWNFILKEKEKEKIIEDCGGHWWFVKEVVRQMATGDDDQFATKEGIAFRMRVVYEMLLPDEQKVLEKISISNTNLTPNEKHSLLFLQRMNFINDKNQCNALLFKKFLLEHFKKKGDLELIENQILLNSVPLTNFFSRKEYRVLKLLLQNKNTIITRDKMAQSIWPINTQEYYSDWAIDQIIARLRKRLITLSLSSDMILSVRGKGYKINI